MAKYSEEQKSVIESVVNGKKRVVVEAFAGSGKTQTLTGIYFSLINKMKLQPERISLIAFTKSAAKTAKKRFSKIIPDASKSKIKTMHSLGLELLKDFPEYKGKKIRVLKDKELIKAAGLDAYNGLSGKDLLKSIQEARERGLDVTNIKEVKDFCALHDKTTNRVGQFLDGFAKYQKLLNQMHSGNFGDPNVRYFDIPDLILVPVEKMENDIGQRNRVRKMLDAVLVDEFQDMNKAQLQFYRLILDDNAIGVVVGDSFQSIYQWRGAQGDSLDQMSREWEVEKMRLTTNYRSTPEILAAANAVVFPGGKCLDMKAVPGKKGPIPELIVTKDEKGEGDFIYTEIKRLIEEEEVKPSEIMVIGRVNNKVDFMRSFVEKTGIKVASISADETVADKCSSLFSWMNNTESRKVLLEMLPPDSPAREIAMKLVDDQEVSDDNLVDKIYDLAEDNPEALGILKAIAEAPVPENMNDAISLAERLGLFWTRELPTAHKYQEVFAQSDDRNDTDKLNEICLESKDDGLEESNEEAVIVSTIHKVKGGQAKYVFIDVTNGDFPRKGKIPSVEELNDLIVALTRAEIKVYLIADGSRGVSCLLTQYIKDPSVIKGLAEYAEKNIVLIPQKEDGDQPPNEEDFIITPKSEEEVVPEMENDNVITGFLSNNASLSEGSSDGSARIKDKFGIEYDSVTNAYWASTTEDAGERQKIANMSAEEVAQYGPKMKRTPIETNYMDKNARSLLKSLIEIKYKKCDKYREELLKLDNAPLADNNELPGTAQFTQETREKLLAQEQEKNKSLEQARQDNPSMEAKAEKEQAPETKPVKEETKLPDFPGFHD